MHPEERWDKSPGNHPGFRHSPVSKLIVGGSPGKPIAPTTPGVDDHRRSILDCDGEGRHDGGLLKFAQR